MSKAHQRSILPVHDMLQNIDANTTELFHYDISPNGVNGTKPVDDIYDSSLLCWLDMCTLSPNGQYVVDRSPRSVHAQLSGATVSNGRKGKALGFNGSNQRLVIPPGSFGTSTPTFTVEAWVNPTAMNANGTSTPIIHNWNAWAPGAQKGFSLRSFNGTHWEFTVADGTGYGSVAMTSPAIVGQWQHLAATYNAGAVALYLNGAQVGTGAFSSSIVFEQGPTYIGYGAINAGWFNGSIDELRVYNRALSASEVANRYNQGIYSLRPDGKYGSCIAVEEATTNMLVTGTGTWPDCNFENPSLYTSDASWRRQIVYDPEATNGVCLEVEALTDKTTWTTAIALTSLLPFTDNNTNFTFSIRYKILRCEDNPAGIDAHRSIAVWSHWQRSAGGSVPSDYTFNSSTVLSPQPWKIFTQTRTSPLADTTGKHFNIGTGSVKAGTKFRIDWIQFEKKSFATSFVNGAREAGQLVYPNILNYSEGTMSFWFKLPQDPPYTPTGWDGYVSTAPDYAGDHSLVFTKYMGGYPERVFGFHWASTDDTANHVAWINTQLYSTGNWNMVTITWKSDRGYRVYANGTLLADIAAAGTGILKPFMLNTLTIKGMTIDELRIDQTETIADEILSWYLASCPFYPKGNERIVL